MAVVFRTLDQTTQEIVEVGVVIDNEYYGDDISVRGLNLDFEGVEDALVERFNGHRFKAVKVPDDEVDLDEFR